MLRKTGSWILVTLVAVGCAHTNLLPQANGDFLMLATSASQSIAFDTAVEKSQQHCMMMGRRFVLVDQRTQYQGMDKTARGVIQAASIFVRPSHYGYMNTSSANDYKVELTFRCL